MHYISGCGLFLAIMVILYQANPVWSDDVYQQAQHRLTGWKRGEFTSASYEVGGGAGGQVYRGGAKQGTIYRGGAKQPL